jgi:hypothetical protein
MFTASRRRSRDRRAVARERHGLFRCSAFAAARVRPPSIQNIRERYSDHVPRARIHGCETFNLLIGSAATATFFGPGADGPALRLVCHTGNRCFLRDLSVGRRATVVIADTLKIFKRCHIAGRIAGTAAVGFDVASQPALVGPDALFLSWRDHSCDLLRFATRSIISSVHFAKGRTWDKKNPAEAIPQAGLFARTEEGRDDGVWPSFFEQLVDRSCFKTIDDPTRSSDREVLALMSD